MQVDYRAVALITGIRKSVKLLGSAAEILRFQTSIDGEILDANKVRNPLFPFGVDGSWNVIIPPCIPVSTQVLHDPFSRQDNWGHKAERIIQR